MATPSLQTAFSSLPDSIRDWLSSEEAAQTISEINEELGLEQDWRSTIPRLVLRLAVQDLNPRDFINETGMYLRINYQAAKTVTEKIINKVMKPIEGELFKIGIDVRLTLDFPSPPLGQLANLPSAPPAGTKPPVAQPLTKPQSAAPPPTNLPLITPKIEPAPTDKPLIIHQEEIKPAQPSGGQGGLTRSLLPAGALSENKTGAPPVRTEIEGMSSHPVIKRVVHYSNYLTPLTQANIQPNKSAERKNQEKEKIHIPKSRWFA